jgi:hypothetical protein
MDLEKQLESSLSKSKQLDEQAFKINVCFTNWRYKYKLMQQQIDDIKQLETSLKNECTNNRVVILLNLNKYNTIYDFSLKSSAYH